MRKAGSTASITAFAGVSINGDNISAQIAQETPNVSGSVADGYTGTATIGIAR